MAATGGDVGRADNTGLGVVGVVVQGVGGEVHVFVAHTHVEVKDGNLRLGVVLAPVGDEGRTAVNHLAALEEIGVVIQTVEVQTVGIQGRTAVLKHDIAAGNGHLVITVVEGVLADQREGVALDHLHMTEGFEGVATLVEVGTVAVQRSTFMTKLHLTVKYLCFGILPLVVVQHVGMDQVDALILLLRSTTGPLLRGITQRAGETNHQKQRQQIERPISHHLSILTSHLTHP